MLWDVIGHNKEKNVYCPTAGKLLIPAVITNCRKSLLCGKDNIRLPHVGGNLLLYIMGS